MTLLICGLLLIGIAIIAWFGVKSPVKYIPTANGKHEIKERKEPVQFTKDFTEWKQYITDLRNGKQ